MLDHASDWWDNRSPAHTENLAIIRPQHANMAIYLGPLTHGVPQLRARNHLFDWGNNSFRDSLVHSYVPQLSVYSNHPQNEPNVLQGCR